MRYINPCLTAMWAVMDPARRETFAGVGPIGLFEASENAGRALSSFLLSGISKKWSTGRRLRVIRNRAGSAAARPLIEILALSHAEGFRFHEPDEPEEKHARDTAITVYLRIQSAMLTAGVDQNAAFRAGVAIKNEALKC